MAVYWVEHHEECRDACEKLLSGEHLPDAERERERANLRDARHKLNAASHP